MTIHKTIERLHKIRQELTKIYYNDLANPNDMCADEVLKREITKLEERL